MNDKQKSILRKLVELACNNNSEGEANSAARTVCKMIKSDEFKLLDSHSYHPPNPPRPSPFESDFVDPFMNMYEEIRNRARQAADRERKRQEDLLDALRKKQREERERKERERKEPKYKVREDAPKWNWGYNPTEAQEDFFNRTPPNPSWDRDAQFYSDVFGRRTGTNKDERPSLERECSRCGGKVRTFRVHQEPFVCGVCEWNHWEGERSESK